MQLAAIHYQWHAEYLQKLVEHIIKSICIGNVAQYGNKLVTANTRDEIIRPQQVLQATRYLPQYFVTDGMAECFVDILEPVDIHERQGKGFLLLHGLLYCDAKQVIQSCTIRQPRQRIMLGE